MIWFTTICEPNYEATGRRAGMKNLLNWVGYSIGPFWMSVAVGSLAAIVLASMVYQLVKRPIRQVLEYPH
jgi:peptidoglycan/LPS O-acetylase OafA/YrhL